MSPTRSTTPADPTASSTTPATSTTSTRVRTPKDPARVVFVGAGPGDVGLLTVRACEFLAAADAVVIDQVSREEFLAGRVRDGVEIVDAGHGEHGQPLTHASRAKLVVKAAKSVGATHGFSISSMSVSNTPMPPGTWLTRPTICATRKNPMKATTGGALTPGSSR